MKNRIPKIFASLSLTFLFAIGMMAQDKTEVTVMVKKDGKVVKDTTYQFEDEAEAKHAMKMMELMTGHDEDMEKVHYNYTTSHKDGKHAHGEHVIVMKSGDGNTFDVLVDEDYEGDTLVKKKHVKVVISDDEHGTWHVDSNELVEIDEDENVFVIKSEDGDVDLEKIMEEHEGENVKVIVIKKGDSEDHDEVEVEVIEKKKKK